MGREYRTLSRLHRGYDRAPRAFLLCETPDVIGATFLVVEYRSGVVIWSEVPTSMALEPDAARRIGFAVVDALAELHRVDPAACRPGRPRPTGRVPGPSARGLAQALGPRGRGER